MPLYRLSATEAVAIRKSNDLARWGDRSSVNRVEPITRPGFRVPFRIEPHSRIFTIGSCFARNVEDELLRRGFDLPTRQVDVDDRAVLNNYGTPSIYNELAWALGEQPYDPDEHILEVRPGRFADIHLAPHRRTQSRAAVLANREAIFAAYRRVRECQTIIMTLGLVELWFDARTGYYLNVGPRPSQIRADPDRFEMHVLSHDECEDYLDRAIGLLMKHCPAGFRVLLTVSPVPLAETHRDEDVIVANMYSKSVLRTVAESMSARYPFITYYPSYESVVTSDRRRAWADDMIHVSKDIVALNVSRMVDAFIGSTLPESDWDALDVPDDPGGLLEAAKRIRSESRELAARFFERFGALSARDPEFALEHAQFLLLADRKEEALALLDNVKDDVLAVQALSLKAEALIGLGRPHDAIALFDTIAFTAQGNRKLLKSKRFWALFLKAAIATGDESVIAATCYKVVSVNAKHEWWAYTRTGLWFLQQARFDKAIHHLELAVNTGEEATDALYFLAEAYTAMDRKDDARIALARLPKEGGSPTSRSARLSALLAPIE